MQKFTETFGPYYKALLAFVVAFTGAAATAAVDGLINYAEWWMIVATAFTALAGVYGVPNKDKRGEHQDESVQPPEDDAAGRHRPEYHGDTF